MLRRPYQPIKLSILITFILCIFLSPASYAQSSPSVSGTVILPFFWYKPQFSTRYSPPRIASVVFDLANTGVALASEGNPGGVLLRTTDYGLTWAQLPAWNPTYTQWSYRLTYGSSPNAYYAWGGASIYKSGDAGDSWSSISYDTNCNQIVTLATHPVSPTVLFVGTINGFAWSTDGGQTWDAPGLNPDFCEGGPYAGTIGIGVDQPNVVYAGQYWYGGGVQRSTDLGATWQPVNMGLPDYPKNVRQVLVDPRNANIVYALLFEAGTVYKTTNGGEQWTLLNQGIETVTLSAIALDQVHGYILYGASTDQIYYLPDDAQAWQPSLSRPIPQPTSQPMPVSIAIDPFRENHIVLHYDSGIWLGLPERGRVLLPMVMRNKE